MSFLTPKETFDAVAKVAEAKCNKSIAKLAVLGLLAGVYIGFGAHLATTVATGSTLGFGITKMFVGAVFSVGLMLVIIAGAELFTGNSLIVAGLLKKKVSLKGLLKNWAIVYLFNLIGSILLAVMIYLSGLNGEAGEFSAVGQTALNIAEAKVGLTIVEMFFRAVLANWLVCLAVVLAVSARSVSGKILACLFPIMAFVAMGFEHSIANMYFLPAGLLLNGGAVEVLTVGSTVLNVAVVTIGNIIGGGFFVATLYWFVNREER